MRKAPYHVPVTFNLILYTMSRKEPLSRYRTNKAKRRVLKLLENAYNTPAWDAGLRWYADAYQMWSHLAHTRGLKTDKVAQVAATLSVGVSWDVNKSDTFKLINAYQNHHDLNSFSVSTYDAMKIKAWGIMQGTAVLEPKSLKTYAFYRNMMLHQDHVTIDRWMLRIFFERPIKSLTAARYRACEDIIRDVSRDMYLLPYKTQAIVWEQARIEAVDSLVEGVLYV